jgi:hypothetical protein
VIFNTQKRREAKVRARFESGFDYAAGLVLRGVPCEEIERQIADCVGGPDVFDKGMRAALATARAEAKAVKP